MPRIPVAAWFVVAVILGGVAYRCLAVQEPLWLDELHTAWCVSDSFTDVGPRARIGNQSPLYFWLEFLVFKAAGSDEIALRLLSLVASLALLGCIAWIVWKVSRSYEAVLLATFLAAIDDNFVFYGVEARPYAMVQLVALWQVFLFGVVFGALLNPADRERPGEDASRSSRVRRPYLGWTLTTLLLFYLHYTTILLIATEVLISGPLLFLIGTRQTRVQMPHWGLAMGVALVGCLPGLYQLAAVGKHRGNWNVAVDADQYGLQAIAECLVYLLPAVAIGMGSAAWSQTPSSVRLVRLGGLLFLLAVLPMMACFLGTVSGLMPLAHYRYSIASSTLLIISAGLFLAAVSHRWRWLAVLLTAGLAMVTHPQWEPWFATGQPTPQRDEPWKTVIEWMRTDGSPIVFCPNLVEDSGQSLATRAPEYEEYYAFALNALYPIDRPANLPRSVWAVPMTEERPQLSVSQWEQLKSGEEPFWLLIRGWSDQANRVAENLVDSLQQARAGRWLAVQKLHAGSLNLYRFDFQESLD